MEDLGTEIVTELFDREKAIVLYYTKLQKNISGRKNDESIVERQFYEQLEIVEGLILDKVAKVKINARNRAKQVIEDKSDRINELQQRIKRSRDWFTSLEHDEQTLTDYEREIEELSVAINQLKTTVFSTETCNHLVDFMNVCEQLVEVHSDETEHTGIQPKWNCKQTISNKQRERQSSASLVVSGHPSINVTEKFDTNATRKHISDVENTIATASIANEVTVTQPGTNDLNVAIAADHDEESNDKSCIYDIENNCAVIIPGSDYGTIKAITVSNDGHIVVLDTDQRAYFSFDSSHRFISKIKFNLKDYPHDVEFLEAQENIVTPVTYGNVNYMLRVLSFGRNQTSFRKIGSTKLPCPMRQHCVSVRTQRNGSFVACIVCPQELRLIYYDKNGRVSKVPQCAVDINDRVMVDYLKQERYAVKLDEKATEAFVIKSDKQSLNCFRLEGETFGQTKWLFESQNMILSDLCVYRKRVFVTENAKGHILEFETDFGQIIHRIDLRPFNISNPFAICIKHNQILLSQHSNSWRSGSRTVSKRKTISILTFKDRTTV